MCASREAWLAWDKADAGKYKYLGVRALCRLEKEELPPEFRDPALLIPLYIKDEHTLWIARHLEGNLP